ncbi:hypothetical protein E4T56_gene12636 [Termitomyces sp. T112]|nr:hypothetical protein E4T56_gene12636 [Termitomyces sp. T112]
MNNNPTTWHARMPLHNDTTVPKWDESRPRELPQYFKELKYLFTNCSITDDTQKKEYALQYISYNTAETWLGLPEFGDNIGNNTPQPYTYQEWKSAVLRLYPGTDASACYNLGNLEWLVNQTFNSDLATLGRFSDYYRDFQRIARWSLTNGKLYHHEEHHLFQQGIPMSLWSKIVCCLEITLPDHHSEDPYDVDQVFKGTKWILKGTDTSTTKTSNGTSGIPLSLPIANAPTAPSLMLKQETLELTTTTAIVSALERSEALLTHGSKVDTVNGLTLDRAPFASVDPIEAYIDSLPHGEEPVVLTVAKDSQSLRTIMMLINNKEEVECIHDSGSQIISIFKHAER